MSFNDFPIFERNLRRLMETPAFQEADDAGKLDMSYRLIRSKYANQPLQFDTLPTMVSPVPVMKEPTMPRILERHWPLPTCDHCGRVRVNEGNCEGCGAPMRFTVPGLPHWTLDRPAPHVPQPAPVVNAEDGLDCFLDPIELDGRFLAWLMLFLALLGVVLVALG